MTSPNFGIGLSPFGLSPAGFGAPAQASSLNFNLLYDQQNSISQDARLIDPATRDYVFNANGNLIGMSSVSQQVFLALLTTLGSASIKTLGNSLLSQKTFSIDLFQSQVREGVLNALSSLIQSNTITVVSVSSRINQSRAGINYALTFIDNTTQEKLTFTQ